MNYRISRNNQEYGPYTIEEITQYVNEGSILPTDYTFNGKEWILVSQLLNDPQKVITGTPPATFNYNATQETNFQEIEQERPKYFRNIFGVIVFLGIAGFYFMQDRNAEKIEKFHNNLVRINKDFLEEFTDGRVDLTSQEGRGEWINKANDALIEIDELVVAPGKKSLGYELKDSVVEMIQLVIRILEESDELGEFEPQFEKLINQFERIQKKYAKNNNMELLH